MSLPARTVGDSVREPVRESGREPGREPGRQYLVVWNPSAGSKAGLPTNSTGEDDLRRTMREAGLGGDIFIGSSEDATRRRIREAVAARVDVIVAAGGDGTAILVAEEVMGTSSALGILPLGSAMNLGRSLGIPRDLATAADLLASGEIVSVDVGKAPDGPFFQMVSVGISAAVLSELNRLIEGEFHSFVSAIRAIVAYRPATMTIELDDETVETHALMVVVANEPFAGAGLTLAPDASMDDGMFDIAVYRRFSRWELVRHLVSIVAGRRRYSPKVRTYRSMAVRISAHRPLPARADARDLGTTPIELEVIPAALRVVVARRESRPPAALGGPALSA